MLDQVEDAAAGVADAGEIIAVAFVAERPELLAEDRFGKANDRGQRGADIAAEAAEEGDVFGGGLVDPAAGVAELLFEDFVECAIVALFADRRARRRSVAAGARRVVEDQRIGRLAIIRHRQQPCVHIDAALIRRLDGEAARGRVVPRVHAGREQQIVQPAMLRESLERAMPDALEERAVGVEQFLGAIDQDAERQRIEQRLIVRAACGRLRVGIRNGVGAAVDPARRIARAQRRRWAARYLPRAQRSSAVRRAVGRCR